MRALLNNYVARVELVKRKIGEKPEFEKSSDTCRGRAETYKPKRASHGAEEALFRFLNPRNPLPPLALRAKERRPLRLDDSLDRFTTRRTGLSREVINAVMALVIADLVERVPVSPIGERRALELDRFLQHLAHRRVDPIHLRAR